MMDWAYDEATHKFTTQIGPCALAVWQDPYALWHSRIQHGPYVYRYAFPTEAEAKGWCEQEATLLAEADDDSISELS